MLKVAIASGKGGTGKTFLATNIFYSLVRSGVRATLVDCDAEAPNAMYFFNRPQVVAEDVLQQVPVINTEVCIYCGICAQWCRYNAIFIFPPEKVITLTEDLCHSCGACLAACKYGAITEKPVQIGRVTTCAGKNKSVLIEASMNVGVVSPVPVIKAALQRIDPSMEAVIIDGPPGSSCPFVHAAAAADYVVLAAEPTPFGLSDLKQTVAVLKSMEKPFGVIINRAGIGSRDIYSYLSEQKIPLLMEVPYDPGIALCYSKGKILACYKKEWQLHFVSVFDLIKEQYGNSGHQR